MTWSDALAEHAEVLSAFLDAMEAVPESHWHVAPQATTWSAAALALHVTDSYAFGREAAFGRASMRRRTPAPVAWFARTVLLPRLLASKSFPRGARAPDEVVPDRQVAASLDQAAMRTRLQRAAAEAVDALREAARSRPAVRITHAYFGPMRPLLALRLLSAHTRHHTVGMRQRG
jgi:uncharacterized damage-inducible protein DinB